MLDTIDEFIILDTEYTSWEGCIDTGWDESAGQYKELVQIAALRVDARTLEVIDEYNRFVKPSINPILSEYFRDLTGISQARVDGAASFATVIETFEDWAGDTPRYSYGNDVSVLVENISLYDLSRNLNRELYNDICDNLAAVGVPVAEYTSGTVVQHFGADPVNQHHNALDDCVNLLRAVRKARDAGA